jgi:CRP-like cAMP-binding protein
VDDEERDERGDIVIEAGRLVAVPLFGDLDAHDLSIVARYVEETLAEPGDLLIEQGAMPYELFVIEEGSVDVVRDGEPLATLGPGEVVGEIALLAHHRRMASVVARTPVRALTLQVDAVQEITREMPEVGAALQSLMHRRESSNEGG